MSIASRLDDLRDELIMAGIPTAWEIEKFRAPGVLLKLQTATAHRLSGDYDLTVQVIVAVPDNRHRKTVTDLEQLLDKVTAIASVDAGVVDFDASLELTNDRQLPAATFTTTLD